MDYSASGVDIERGDAFASFIRQFPSNAVSKSLGGFSGGVPFDPSRYREPVLLSTTDGVGTKILVARRLGIYDTIGIDLVAMSVNDMIVCGAEPISFLDYIACGKVRPEILHPIISGVIKGCEMAGCTLAGGETAEMPDVYGEDDFDLAGFCNGIAEKSTMLPQLDRIKAGDRIFAMPSSGVHSNGFSLARKAIPLDAEELYRELLVPTRIYVKDLAVLLDTGMVPAAAHITGGGLEANFARVVPEHLQPRFSWSWPVPPIFEAIAKHGSIDSPEMRRVFNMGIGIAFVVSAEGVDAVGQAAAKNGIRLLEIGELVRG